MTRYLRTSAIVHALHLNKDALPADIADFVTEANGDFAVNIKTSSVVLRNRKGGYRLDAVVGDWLVRSEQNELGVYGDDEFRSIHEYVGE